MVQLQHVDVSDRHLYGRTPRLSPAVDRASPDRTNRQTRHLQRSLDDVGFSRAPSKTGVAIGTPRLAGYSPSSARARRSFMSASIVDVHRRRSDGQLRLRSGCNVVRLQIGVDRVRRPDLPRPAQAQPRCVSRICPTFMRLGTPSGFSTISTGVAVLQERHVLDCGTILARRRPCCRAAPPSCRRAGSCASPPRRP